MHEMRKALPRSLSLLFSRETIFCKCFVVCWQEVNAVRRSLNHENGDRLCIVQNALVIYGVANFVALSAGTL